MPQVGVDRGAYAEGNASQLDYAHRALASSLPTPRCCRASVVSDQGHLPNMSRNIESMFTYWEKLSQNVPAGCDPQGVAAQCGTRP